MLLQRKAWDAELDTSLAALDEVRASRLTFWRDVHEGHKLSSLVVAQVHAIVVC